MRETLQKIADRYRYSLILLRELVKTDFKLRYQGSMLGMVWSVLKPLMLFAVMYVVFVRFLRFGAGIPHFAVSLLLAQTLWSFFQESTSQGMRAIVDRGDLLRKINFADERESHHRILAEKLGFQASGGRSTVRFPATNRISG